MDELEKLSTGPDTAYLKTYEITVENTQKVMIYDKWYYIGDTTIEGIPYTIVAKPD